MKTPRMTPPAGRTPSLQPDLRKPSLDPAAGAAPDIPVADLQRSLGRALEGISQRLSEISNECVETKRARKALIQSVVTNWVPDLSRETARRLFEALPALDTSSLQRSFQTRKFWGLFETDAYRGALEHARITLSSFLDRTTGVVRGFPAADDLAPLTQQVARLDEERTELQRRQSEIGSLIARTQEAQRRGVRTIPAAVLPQKPDLTKTPQPARGSGPGAPVQFGRSDTYHHPSSFSSPDYRPHYGDDTDLWLYYLTDIPTSGRTLLWDALTSPQAPSPAPAPPWAPDPVPAPDAPAIPDFDFSSTRALGESAPADIPAFDGGSSSDNAAWGAAVVGESLLPSFDAGQAEVADQMGSYS